MYTGHEICLTMVKYQYVISDNSLKQSIYIISDNTEKEKIQPRQV
jgi:hypothetical protein